MFDHDCVHAELDQIGPPSMMPFPNNNITHKNISNDLNVNEK